MIDINNEKKKVKGYEYKINELNVKRIRLEESERNIKERIKELESNMTELEVTPENIGEVINNYEKDIIELSLKIDVALGLRPKEELEQYNKTINNVAEEEKEVGSDYDEFFF